MFRYSIGIDEYTDPSLALKDFATACRKDSIDDPDTLIGLVEHAVNELAERGSQLASVGSQFHITRELEDEQYHVTLKASFGAKRSFISKIKSMIGK